MTIERIATGGDGVGRLPDGMTVFVPRTAPGDRATIDVIERRRRWARGRLLGLEGRGAERVAPACPHYEDDDCGGCQLQHLGIEAQRRAKQTIVRDVLRRVGRIDVSPPELVPAPEAWRYRSRITLAPGPGGVLGFHRVGRPGDVFALEDCHLARPELVALLARVRRIRERLPDGIEAVVLRLDREGGLHLVVRGGTPPWDGAAFAGALGEPPVTVWWAPEGGAARVVAGAGGAFPALAFQQSSPALAERMRRDALAWLEPGAGRVVWDLYGGVGDGARALAAAGASVWCVDADRSAIAWAERQATPAPAPTYVAGRVEEVLHRLPPPDGIVLNPPRTGAAERVMTAISRLAGGVRRIAYVSCDPATLARDLGRLRGFRLQEVAAYDLFPQTAHIEILARLEAA